MLIPNKLSKYSWDNEPFQPIHCAHREINGTGFVFSPNRWLLLLLFAPGIVSCQLLLLSLCLCALTDTLAASSITQQEQKFKVKHTRPKLLEKFVFLLILNKFIWNHLVYWGLSYSMIRCTHVMNLVLGNRSFLSRLSTK